MNPKHAATFVRVNRKPVKGKAAVKAAKKARRVMRKIEEARQKKRLGVDVAQGEDRTVHAFDSALRRALREGTVRVVEPGTDERDRATWALGAV